MTHEVTERGHPFLEPCLHETGRDVSEWFSLSTEVVMQTFAERAGLIFKMEKYDEETGAAEYSFEQK